ncbi:hypothetical protein [Mesorhizobium sp. M7A.F.Ca.US.008.03.1.1]|uniref:hypothetical protein n=1 Tax=Mesorhizobium sp. M7A.F.Ca.US.008.03.1.1 TaxID=2496742 RepID=UPI0019D11ABB|nr:hypothetical protein [Mesorhizobium sp. M7A.F.Ca.US.008.03.1.1]
MADELVEHKAAASLTAAFFSLATATPVAAKTTAAQNTATLIGTLFIALDRWLDMTLRHLDISTNEYIS